MEKFRMLGLRSQFVSYQRDNGRGLHDLADIVRVSKL